MCGTEMDTRVDINVHSRLSNKDENNNNIDNNDPDLDSKLHSNSHSPHEPPGQFVKMRGNREQEISSKQANSNLFLPKTRTSHSHHYRPRHTRKFSILQKNLLLFLLLPTTALLFQQFSLVSCSVSSSSSSSSSNSNSISLHSNQRQFRHHVYPQHPHKHQSHVPSTLSTPLHHPSSSSPPLTLNTNKLNTFASPTLSTPATTMASSQQQQQLQDPINHSLENTINTGNNNDDDINHDHFIGDILKTSSVEDGKIDSSSNRKSWQIQKSQGVEFSYTSEQQPEPLPQPVAYIQHPHPQQQQQYQYQQHPTQLAMSTNANNNINTNVFDDGINEKIQPDSQSLTLHIHTNTNNNHNNPLHHSLPTNPSLRPQLPSVLINKIGDMYATTPSSSGVVPVYPNNLYEINDPLKPLPKSIADRIFVRHSTRKRIRLPVYTTVYSNHKIIPDRPPRQRGRHHRRPPAGKGRGRRRRPRQRPRQRPRGIRAGIGGALGIGGGGRGRGRGRGRRRRPQGNRHHHQAGSSQFPAFAPAFVSYGPIYGTPPGIDIQQGNYGVQSQQSHAISGPGHSGPARPIINFMQPPVPPPKIPYAPPMIIHPNPNPTYNPNPNPAYNPRPQNVYQGHQESSFPPIRGAPRPSVTISMEAPSNEYSSQPLAPHGTSIPHNSNNYHHHHHYSSSPMRPMFSNPSPFGSSYSSNNNFPQLANPTPTFGPPRPSHLFPIPIVPSSAMTSSEAPSPPHFQLNYAQQSRPESSRFVPPPPQHFTPGPTGPSGLYNNNNINNIPHPNNSPQPQHSMPMNFGHPMHNFGPPGASHGQPSPFMDQHPKDPWQTPIRYAETVPGVYSLDRPPTHQNQLYPTAPPPSPPPSASPLAGHNSPYNNYNNYNSNNNNNHYAPNYNSLDYYSTTPKNLGDEHHFKESSGFGFPPNSNDIHNNNNNDDGYSSSSSNSNGNSNSGRRVKYKKYRKRPAATSTVSSTNYFDDGLSSGGKSAYWNGKESDNFHLHDDPLPPPNLYDSFGQNGPGMNNKPYRKGAYDKGSYKSGNNNDNFYNNNPGDDRNYKYSFGKAKLNLMPSDGFAFEDIDNHRNSKNGINVDGNDYKGSSSSTNYNNNNNNNNRNKYGGRPKTKFNTDYNSPGMSKNPKLTDFHQYRDMPRSERIKMGYSPHEKIKSTKYSTLPNSMENYKNDPEHEKYPKLTYDDSLIRRILPKNSEGPTFLTEEKKIATFSAGSEFKRMLNEHDKMRL